MRVANKDKKLKSAELRTKSEKCHKNALNFCGGVTLMSLIIIVIILLILAGVSINVAINGNVIESANEAVNKTHEQIDEQQQMVNEVRNLYR